MKIFEKKRWSNGKREFFLFGKMIYSYRKKNRPGREFHTDEYCLKYENRFAPDLSLTDKRFILKEQFQVMAGYTLNLDDPVTFNEKLQWLKLYNEDPLITTCVGKDTAKDYVAKVLGEKYLVPTIAVYEHAQDIDFSKLPDAFVLKVCWGSGQNIIVRDKSKMNKKEILEKLKKWLDPRSNHYFYSFEYGYKNVPPRIICEKYMGELSQNLTCYKVFNFCSKSYLIQAVFDDKTDYETINYYDLNWKKLELRQNYPNNDRDIPPPKHLDEMLKCAGQLAQPFKYFVRTDFFEVGDSVLFSEFTFYSDNGMERFHPAEWDRTLGDLIDLRALRPPISTLFAKT